MTMTTLQRVFVWLGSMALLVISAVALCRALRK
jgi:hypothetical protein